MEDQLVNILYVDDEVHNLNAFKASFRRSFNVFTAESAKEAMPILAEHSIQIIITDQRMPQMSGVEFLESILEAYPDPIRILLTGYADIAAVIDAINKGQVYLYITKPWQETELKLYIEKAFEVFQLRKENKELTKKLLIVNEQLEFMLRQKLIS
ncbi:Response regulator receiver domain-containing protein [Pedobacter steynii]|jgi:response regulator RpfG family c-di-GMP phosphodiesterase|uniref:Response regulator receiver domain-containing protein n=1 Tax=Pedobacter steynii TaxID=430522 RepID=A0A1G9R7W7_9SPHI|nr:response regulator [Pedobacter steynii]NQX37854.1 response regulator [Pedobacter steynii]SDM18917.1 Response regulator receiver domain-containing protein [Pedobacter steynii]